MKKLTLDQIEIIGFNGTPTAGCGQAIPVAKEKNSDRYFISLITSETIDPQASVKAWKLEELRKRGNVTYLPECQPARPFKIVFYLTQTFLNALGYQTPEHFDLNFHWQRLIEDDLKDHTWATYGNKVEIDALMDNCADRLHLKSSRLLVDYFSSKDQRTLTDAEKVADMALYTARDKKRRADNYLPYGVAIRYSDKRARVDKLYEMFIRHEFNWTWEEFITRLDRYADSLKAGVLNPPLTYGEITFEEVANRARLIHKISDLKEKINMAVEIAESYQRQSPPDPKIVEELKRELDALTQIKLSDTERLKVFAADASFYFLEDVVKYIEDRYLYTLDYRYVANECCKLGIKLSPIAEHVCMEVAQSSAG